MNQRSKVKDEVVDSHQHFWDIDRFTYRWMPPGPGLLRRNYLPAHFAPLRKQNGILSTVVVEAHNSTAETLWLLDMAEREPFIAGVVGWVDLTSANVAEQLDRLSRYSKLVGIRHQVESDPDDDWLARESVTRGLREIARRGLAYDLVVFPRHLRHIPALAERLPELRLVLDHLGKPPIAVGALQPWADLVEKIAEQPNVWCKISGLVTEAAHTDWTARDLSPYVQFARERFGMERLMWGSDWPVCLKAATYEQTLTTALEALGKLTDAQRRMFLSGNAVKFYRLKL